MLSDIVQEKKFTILFGFVGFILIIVFLSTLISALNKAVVAKIHIEGIPSVLLKDEGAIESSLFDSASNNVSINTTIKNSSATIIQDSYKEEQLDTYSHITFLVKIANLDQEYLVQYNDGEDFGGYKISVACVSSCATTGNSQDSLKYVLPYSSTTSETHWTIEKGDYFSPKNTDLVAYIDSCVKNFDTGEIESDIKAFLAKYNISNYNLKKIFSCNSEY